MLSVWRSTHACTALNSDADCKTRRNHGYLERSLNSIAVPASLSDARSSDLSHHPTLADSCLTHGTYYIQLLYTASYILLIKYFALFKHPPTWSMQEQTPHACLCDTATYPYLFASSGIFFALASELEVLQIQLGSKFQMQSASKLCTRNGQRSQHLGTLGHAMPKAIAG